MIVNKIVYDVSYLIKEKACLGNDFYEFCHKRNINILQSVYMTRAKVRHGVLIRAISNFFTEEVMFVISR